MQVHRKKCMTMYIEFKRRMTPGWRDQHRNSAKRDQNFKGKWLKKPRCESVGSRMNPRGRKEKSMRYTMNPTEHGVRPVWPDVEEPNTISLETIPKMRYLCWEWIMDICRENQ